MLCKYKNYDAQTSQREHVSSPSSNQLNLQVFRKNSIFPNMGLLVYL